MERALYRGLSIISNNILFRTERVDGGLKGFGGLYQGEKTFIRL